MADLSEFAVKPDPDDKRLLERVTGIDHDRKAITVSVTVERVLTLYLNSQEIVTMMTIGDYPEYLDFGFLRNQNLLRSEDQVTRIDYDEDVKAVIVRTETETNYEQML